MPVFRFFIVPGETTGAETVPYLEYIAGLTTLAVSADRIRMSEDPGEIAVLRGSGFSTRIEGGVGTVTGGTITAINASLDGTAVFTATGLSISAAALFGAIAADDELAYFNALLGGNDKIFGTGGGDSLLSLGGNDTVFGGGGSDEMAGGKGRDVLDGGGAADFMDGEGGNDILRGGTGADVLESSLGKDILSGGAGADQFLFGDDLVESSQNRITDFEHGVDLIVLPTVTFPAAGDVGPLSASAFRRGAGAVDADDSVIYNPANGQLIYDSNGNLSGGTSIICLLEPGLNLRAGDILIGATM